MRNTDRHDLFPLCSMRMFAPTPHLGKAGGLGLAQPLVLLSRLLGRLLLLLCHPLLCEEEGKRAVGRWALYHHRWQKASAQKSEGVPRPRSIKSRALVNHARVAAVSYLLRKRSCTHVYTYLTLQAGPPLLLTQAAGDVVVA